MDLTEKIKTKAKEIGFNKVGITDVTPLPEKIQSLYSNWLKKDYNAGMEYLEKSIDIRLNPAKLFQNAKSIVSLAINYNPGFIGKISSRDIAFISRYALGKDYHKIISHKLELLLAYIKQATRNKASGKTYCDTGPILEKLIAERAGLGWIGKNSALITKDFGSWVFLGEIVLDIELKKDLPAKNLCSDCNLCIEACPTVAIVAPGVIDTSRCLSYLTVENRGGIPIDLREALENKVFGCDTCQEVCPFNSNVAKTTESCFLPWKHLLGISLKKLFIMAYENFEGYFSNSAIKRTKRSGLFRNIIVAMGNSQDKQYLPLLKKLLTEEDSIVKNHVEWAIKKLKGENGRASSVSL